MRRTAALLSFIVSAALPAQRADSLRAGVNRHVPAGAAPALSLVLPGAGQFAQGKQRFVLYATVEAIYWWRYTQHAAERRRAANDYKDLARRVARAHFQPNGSDGDWTYYESMRDYLESGDFSTSETGPVVPEPNPETFNGRLWLLIRRTTPGCSDQAQTCDLGLARYTEGAIPADRQWSWRNAQIQFDLYKRTTELRNDANHAVTRDLSIIAFNHLLSMVDAFSVLRLEAHVDTHGRTAMGAQLQW